MNKRTMIFVVAAAASLLTAGIALADPKPSHHQAWLDSLGKGGGGEVANVGDPFVVDQPVNPRAACEAAGGTPKTQMQDDGTLGIRCLPGVPTP